MSAQLAIDFARIERDSAMQRVGDKAERLHEGWSDEAAAFLRWFAERNEWFISEDVSAASRAAGIRQPHTDRAWGHIYRRAVRDGLIVQDGCGRSTRRHLSICPRWRSSIYNRALKQ